MLELSKRCLTHTYYFRPRRICISEHSRRRNELFWPKTAYFCQKFEIISFREIFFGQKWPFLEVHQNKQYLYESKFFKNRVINGYRNNHILSWKFLKKFVSKNSSFLLFVECNYNFWFWIYITSVQSLSKHTVVLFVTMPLLTKIFNHSITTSDDFNLKLFC